MTGSQLDIGTAKGFSSDQPIQLTVTVPTNKLQALSVVTAAQVYVEGGAVAPSFNASFMGAGGLTMVNVNVTDLGIFATGCVQ